MSHEAPNFNTPTPSDVMERLAVLANLTPVTTSFSKFIEVSVGAGRLTVIRGLQGSGFIPGNLQTARYARELFLSNTRKSYSTKANELFVDTRSGRGELVLASRAIQEYLLPSSALRPPIDETGKPRVTHTTMREQLGRLIELAGPGAPVSVRIAPEGRFIPGMGVDYLFPDGQQGEPHVFAESTDRMIVLGPEGATDMIDVWETVQAAALSVEESLELMKANWGDLAA